VVEAVVVAWGSRKRKKEKEKHAEMEADAQAHIFLDEEGIRPRIYALAAAHVRSYPRCEDWIEYEFRRTGLWWEVYPEHFLVFHVLVGPRPKPRHIPCWGRPPHGWGDVVEPHASLKELAHKLLAPEIEQGRARLHKWDWMEVDGE